MHLTSIATVTYNVDFKPLFIFLGIALFVSMVYALINEVKLQGIPKKMAAGDYVGIIKNGERLLRVYSKHSSKSIMRSVEYLHFALAVSYFSMSDDDHFLLHINAMNAFSDVKEFWLALFCLNKDDLEAAFGHYNRISCTDDTYIVKTYFEAYYAYKTGEEEAAKSKMDDIYERLTHPVLKQIANNIL